VSAPRTGGGQPLLIATRASELAVRQARQVQEALAQRGVAAELKTYRTTGDKRLDEPLSAIGGKGLFTRELETDLAKGVVDCCVHSLKIFQPNRREGWRSPRSSSVKIRATC
jgi:hydroxymethylbilane synthase